MRRFAERLDECSRRMADWISGHAVVAWCIGMACVAPVLFVNITHSALTVFQMALAVLLLLPVMGWLAVLVALAMIAGSGAAAFALRKFSTQRKDF
jgi:predicted PurR-regulated permease PerM